MWEPRITLVDVTWVGLVWIVTPIVNAIIIQHALEELGCVTNAKTGLLENFASIVGLEVMVMLHQVKAVMDVTAMNMEAKHLVFVIFKLVYVSAKTIPWGITVIGVNLATMETPGMEECVTISVWQEVFCQELNRRVLEVVLPK